MPFAYSPPSRANEPNQLPNVEVFYEGKNCETGAGYYWWPCFPGCMPDGEAIGPFNSYQEALKDAEGEEQ